MIGREQRRIKNEGQQTKVTRRLAARPVGETEQDSEDRYEEMRKRRRAEDIEAVEQRNHQPGVGYRDSRHRQRAGAKQQGCQRRSGAPGQQSGRFVARQMIHLADKSDGAAKCGRGDDEQRLADRRMIAALQHRTADISGQDESKKRADAPESRDRLPIGGHEDENGSGQQQRRHHRQYGAEAQRAPLVAVDVQA
ncbi:hypothetical protein COL154_014138 [Colletotrichum chrysophilum]|nr:hypothetical protein COL154_014138 [Colletotrichum chrysophilum]